MTPSWSSGFLNSLVAPEFTMFRAATIPDLTDRHPEAPHWLANFFLNSAVRASFKPPLQQVSLGYLRRASQGFTAYHRARDATLQYLAKYEPHTAPVRPYFEAVALWEEFVLQVAMAIDLYNWLSKPQRAFSKNDGSPEQRLYTMANHVKHVGSCVDSGQCTEQDSLPLWLNNSGLQSFGTSLSFTEASELLSEVASLADVMQGSKGHGRNEPPTRHAE